jgi:hypothetical protein
MKPLDHVSLGAISSLGCDDWIDVVALQRQGDGEREASDTVTLTSKTRP